MNTSAHLAPPSASRLTGLGLAIGIHLLAALALASAFVIQQQPKPPVPPKIQILKDEPVPPPPLPHLPRPELPVTTSRVVEVPIPLQEFTVSQPTVVTAPETDRPREIAPTQPSVSPPLAKAKPALQGAGAVCTKMSTPVMPNVTGAGEALFRVTASTQAGRVTGIDIQALRNTMDGRSLRAFKSSIESALREGYECPGNVSFVQEFQFRLD